MINDSMRIQLNSFFCLLFIKIYHKIVQNLKG